MKIIFLDVDGVLCLNGRTLPPEPLEQLKRIIEATGAQIVLSSTWRIHDESKTILWLRFQQIGVPTWIDQTPDLNRLDQLVMDGVNDVPRHLEIGEWFRRATWLSGPGVRRFAIIDDMDSAEYPGRPECFFRTSLRTGLTADIADRVIAYLNAEDA